MGVLVPSGFPPTRFLPHSALSTAKKPQVWAQQLQLVACGEGARGSSIPSTVFRCSLKGLLCLGAGSVQESLNGSIIPGAAPKKNGAKRLSWAPGVMWALWEHGDLAGRLGEVIHLTGSGEGIGTCPSPKDREERSHSEEGWRVGDAFLVTSGVSQGSIYV